MPEHLMLLAPSANRVYAGEAATLARSELEVSAPFVRDVTPAQVAGVDYLGFGSDGLGPDELQVLARQSAALALFTRVEADQQQLLAPVELPDPFTVDDDLVTIPKYPGKTNEQFTQLLLNVTLASIERPADGPRTVLDPLAGRGTTLCVAWMLGHEAYGVEGDEKAVEQMAAFLKTWLRRKRLKHTAAMTPVRREGKSIGKRFDAELRLPQGSLPMAVFTGDTRTSARLFGKKRFDAIVTDAPYGVVHGAHQATDVRGHAGKRDRSPAGLLGEAVPVWASQLKPGGALGLSWNTHGLSREQLCELLAANGLEPREGEAWLGFSHRVDSSINRDLVVAVKKEER